MVFPMFAVVLLTFIIALIAIKNRVSSVRSGRVKIKYFRLMEGAETPESITKTTRCFNNMFEIPVLFYTAGIMYIILGVDSLFELALAWIFVVCRYLQAFVHLTYNNVLHRMVFFWLAFVSAMGLWVNLLLLSCTGAFQLPVV